MTTTTATSEPELSMHLTDIDLRLLDVFVAVVESRGIASAQTLLNRDASTISRQLRQLEERLNLRLCERGRSGFALTTQGERVYRETLALNQALGRFLVRGEPGCDIIPELAPESGEPVLDKPGNGAFHATDLDQILRAQGIRHLLITGVTTDVCVHSTLREANVRGYDCLLLQDGCGAGDPSLHQAALAMMDNEGGIFGARATVTALTEAWST